MKYSALAVSALACLGLVGAALAQAEPTAAKPGKFSFTTAQAENGKAEYQAQCIACHGPNLNDGEFGGPPLKGETFRSHWFDQPAAGLVGFTRTAMPPDAPGRMPLDGYVEIVAYLLSANGVAPSAHAAPADMDALGVLTIAQDAR